MTDSKRFRLFEVGNYYLILCHTHEVKSNVFKKALDNLTDSFIDPPKTIFYTYNGAPKDLDYLTAKGCKLFDNSLPSEAEFNAWEAPIFGICDDYFPTFDDICVFKKNGVTSMIATTHLGCARNYLRVIRRAEQRSKNKVV